MDFSIKLFTLVFLALNASSFASQTTTPNCYEEKLPRPYKVCLHPGEGENRQTILYFHGLGGNETNWGSEKHYSLPLLKGLAEKGVPKPQVISISFGMASFLIGKNTAPESGLLEAFLFLILPKIENKLPYFPSNYWIIGESMGGFNAYYTSLFTGFFRVPVSHVISLCPALVEMSPYDTRENQERIRKNIGMRIDRFASYLALSRRFVGSHLEWFSDNPFTKTREVFFPLHARYHLSCGDADAWGFHAGAKKMATLLSNTFTSVEWKSYPGEDHCAVHTEDLVDFLIH